MTCKALYQHFINGYEFANIIWSHKVLMVDRKTTHFYQTVTSCFRIYFNLSLLNIFILYIKEKIYPK